MSYISLYRKYRPNNFHDVIDQDITISTLKNSIKLNRLAHSYIFSGPKGTGKTTVAKIFAKAINCLNNNNGDACNTCNNCLLINNNQTTDIIELDAASNNGIEDIRRIINEINYLPIQLNKKVYIIDEAHMLTTQAWNALLKTIEEPPKHIIFIFATTEVYKIPQTITSRCQQYFFNRIKDNGLKTLLNKVCMNENIQYDNNALDKIIFLSEGSARDALSILEQLATYNNNNINLETINHVFGLIDKKQQITIINLIKQNELKRLLQTTNKFIDDGINLLVLVRDILSILIDRLIYLQTKETSILKTLDMNDIDQLDFNYDQLIQMINIWEEGYNKIKNSIDQKFYFEMIIFQISKIFAKNLETENNTKQNQQIENTESIELAKKEEKLPPISQIGSFEEVIIAKPKIDIIEEKIEYKYLFFCIANNYKKEIRELYENILKHIRQTNDETSFTKQIKMANTIATCSNNGIVLFFEDDIDAKLFNKKSQTVEWLIEINKYFKKPIYIFGFDKKEIQQAIEEYKIAKSKNINFNDCDITVLRDKINNENPILRGILDIVK